MGVVGVRSSGAPRGLGWAVSLLCLPGQTRRQPRASLHPTTRGGTPPQRAGAGEGGEAVDRRAVTGGGTGSVVQGTEVALNAKGPAWLCPVK